MTAKLVLLPLSNSESRKLLKDSGKYPQKIEQDQGFAKLPPAELEKAEQAYKRPRKTITLILPKESNIIDLNEDDEIPVRDENNEVIYSKEYEDGSIAARVPLGRNERTGIDQWTKISRALCEVSLHKPIEGGKVVVDLLDSADNGKLKSDTSVDDHDNNKKPSPKRGGNNDKAIASLGMRKSAGDHYVWLDGQLIKAPLGREIEIQNGSILSLFGVTGLSYQIKLFQDGDKKKSPKKKSPKKRKLNTPTKKEKTPVNNEKEIVKEELPTERDKLRKRAHDDMIAECMCAMCMEILVKSTFAYPWKVRVCVIYHVILISFASHRTNKS